MPAVVRPRRLWLGVALAAAGMLVTGIGAVVPSTPTIVVGVPLMRTIRPRTEASLPYRRSQKL